MSAVVDISLEDIIFCGHMNEDVCDLGKTIKVVKENGSVQFEFKKASGRGMRSVDVIGLVDDEKFMVGQLMVQKEGSRGYIVREVTRWRDLKLNLCGELSDGCDGCKLKDLETKGEELCDDWCDVASLWRMVFEADSED
jgi:hypothetical protein